MSFKTVLRFSKNILREIPSMAADSALAGAGDVRAWIHTAQRAVEGIGSTVLMCIQIKSVHKLKAEAEAEIQSMQEQLNSEKIREMEKSRKKLSEIEEQLRLQGEKLEQYINETKQRTEVLNKGVDTADIDREISRETEELIEMKRSIASERMTSADAQARTKRKQVERDIKARSFPHEVKETARKEIKKALEVFDNSISTNPLYKELPQEEKLRLDNLYSLLLWQYKNKIDV